MFSFHKMIIVFSCIFLLGIQMPMAQYDVPEGADQSKPFPWPEGKQCAVSLTFDDARLTQIDAGIPLLNKNDVKATFYISPNRFIERLQEWKAAVEAGHEIGNHTMTHPCTGNYAFSRDNALEEYTLERIAGEMDKANEFIYGKINVHAISFAYPCGQKFVGRGEDLQSYVPLVAKKFLTGRGWLGESTNDPWFCDFAQLLGMESDGKSFEELKRLVDMAKKERTWLILAGHEMGESGHQTTLLSSVEQLCQYAQDPANGIWMDTVASVAEYIQEVRSKTMAK